MKIKGFLQDVGGADRVTSLRRETINNASATPDPKDHIREISDRVHPGKKTYVVKEIRDASPSSKTYRLSPKDGIAPVFMAGQYMVIHQNIGQSVLTRAYSISSAPYEALSENGYIEFTVRKNRPYLVPDHLEKNLSVGDEIEVDLPFSDFFYQPLRDSKNVVALAGGSGITPFVSMAKEVAAGKLDINLTILYGSVKHNDIVCGDELSAAEKKADGKIKVINIMSDDPEWTGEKGFLSKEIIKKYSGEDPTYFFCGPRPMYELISGILKDMGVPGKRLRYEAMQQPGDASQIPGFPAENIGKTCHITVVRGISETTIEARMDEPVAVSLERAGIPVDCHCRAGECGYCRAKLLSGDIFVSPFGDGRRREDKEMGWFHSCSSYPKNDLRIKVPII